MSINNQYNVIVMWTAINILINMASNVISNKYY